MIFWEKTKKERRISGQNAVEYLLVFSGVVLIILFVTKRGGIVENTLNKSLTEAVEGIRDIPENPCLTTPPIDGGWTDWGVWGSCTLVGGTTCEESRSRSCSNPFPRCGGDPCAGDATETRECFAGTWTPGIWGPCTGACASTIGVQTRVNVCSGGCCDPSAEPATSQACTKDAYTGTWTYGPWVCSVACGVGVETRTETCTDAQGCCDPTQRQETVRTCAYSCCADVEPDITSDGGGISGAFPDTFVGETATIGCPSGYVGVASKPCLSGAVWGGLTSLCTPAPCPATSVNAGPINVTLGPATNGSMATVNCTDVDPLYEGTVSGKCDHGAWTNVSGECSLIPKTCPALINEPIGSGQTANFPETDPGNTVEARCPTNYVPSVIGCPAATGYEDYLSGDGTWTYYTGRATKDCIWNGPRAEWRPAAGSGVNQPCTRVYRGCGDCPQGSAWRFVLLKWRFFRVCINTAGGQQSADGVKWGITGDDVVCETSFSGEYYWTLE